MAFKALAIDLDGTLLVGERIPVDNVDAVRSARDAGFKIVIATARWHQMALRVAAELEIDGPIIACSGAQVHLPDAGRTSSRTCTGSVTPTAASRPSRSAMACCSSSTASPTTR
jgi:hydroxymethylpyrimidine pyrophosphatase-like HAD family hydrolase